MRLTYVDYYTSGGTLLRTTIPHLAVSTDIEITATPSG
jgi:hypothetical protein